LLTESSASICARSLGESLVPPTCSRARAAIDRLFAFLDLVRDRTQERDQGFSISRIVDLADHLGSPLANRIADPALQIPGLEKDLADER
jgi:hypothetical protein